MGQLHLPITPSQELLALSDPWDPVQNNAYRMHDLVLFNSRYYLYHGSGPAILLFAPWRLLTGRDLPEPAAVAIFCIAGFLFYSAALLCLLKTCDRHPSSGVLSISMLTLAVCQSAPYLCNRVDVYEVAIAGGLFCVAAGFFFFIKGLTSAKVNIWFGASGSAFGLAITCRPHMAFAGLIVFVVLTIWISKRPRGGGAIAWKGAWFFLTALSICCTVLGLYNYVRFGDPLEFGLRYLLAGEPGQQRVLLSVANLWRGLYYLLLCPPDFSLVFPWIRLALRLPFGSTQFGFPPGYFLEPVAGALWIAPFLVAAVILPSDTSRTARFASAAAVLASVFVLLFVAATGFTTERYLADFLPLLVFAAVANLTVRWTRSPGRFRDGTIAIASVLIAYSVIANLALGITGPYGDMVSKRPSGYVRIAGWFSPTNEHRLRLNPSLRIILDVQFTSHEVGYQEPLVTIGNQGARHSVLIEHQGPELRLLCRSEGDSESWAASIVRKPSRIEISHDQQEHQLNVAIDGLRVIQRPVNVIVAAPAQIMIGSNGLSGYVSQSFTGDIHVVEKTFLN